MVPTDGLQGMLGEPPSDEFGDYRAISAMAVAALLVGAASAAALIGVPLWIVPLVGILLSCLALVRIDRAAGRLIGRALALTGLALAVCFGTAAVAAHVSAQYLLTLKAREVAGQWFQALAQGDSQVAHQWTMGPVLRAETAGPESLHDFYENDDKRRDTLAHFVDQKLITSLLRFGKRARVAFESAAINRIDDHLCFVSLIYRVTADEAGKPVEFSAELTLEQRDVPALAQARWSVRGWRFVGPEPTAVAKDRPVSCREATRFQARATLATDPPDAATIRARR